MEYRKLGRSSLRIAPLALGGNVFGWPIASATSVLQLEELMKAAALVLDDAMMMAIDGASA